MKSLLTPAQFAAEIIGTPWARWRSDWLACDCYGLIVLYHREVVGIDLGRVPQTDIATGFAQAAGWVECSPEAGAMAFMAFVGGAPRHCGILLEGGRVLHSEGGDGHMGSVRLGRLSMIERIYGPVKCYRYAPC